MKLRKHVFLLVMVALAVFGQPNGLFLLFPVINVLTIGAAMMVSLAMFSDAAQVPWFLPREYLNFLGFSLLYLLLGFLSSVYAPDGAFAARMGVSVAFKILLSIQIVFYCRDLLSLRDVLKVIAYLGTYICLSGIILTVLATFHIISPATTIGESDVSANMSYDQKLDYYRFLGFVRSGTTILDLVYPRLQSWFIEPGYFAFFTECSIFATLGLTAYAKEWRPRRVKLMLRIQLCAIFMSLSVGGIACLLVGYLYYRRRTSPFKLTRTFISRLALGTVLLAAALAFLDHLGVLDILYRVFIEERFKTDYGANSADNRSNSLALGIKFFLESPLWGWGINQARVITGVGINNTALTVLVELGLVGFTFYLCMIGSSFLQVYRLRKYTMDNGIADPLVLGAAISGMFISMFLHSLLIDSFWTFQCWLAIGLLFATRNTFKLTTKNY